MKTIPALQFDKESDGWEKSRGFFMREVPIPQLEDKNPADAVSVILKIKYAGVCGSDRGIFHRASFKDLIHNSLAKEGKTARILGHEFFGEIIEVGPEVNELYGLKPGDRVSGDSHITCGKCYQCRIGENNVCTNEQILGISIDGIFSEYVKIPAKNLWKINESLVRPEIAAIYDPMGNAMHAVSKTDVKGKTIAVLGCGPIGLFSIVFLKSFGASEIIAVDIESGNLKMASALGARRTIQVLGGDNDGVVQKIVELTGGVGADVSMEMAGPNSSVINAIGATRRGGNVILFGLKDGDFTIPKFSTVITKGLTLHGVIGRRIFETWSVLDRVISDKSNGVGEKIFNVILKRGEGTIIPFSKFENGDFEKSMDENPKIIFRF